MLFFFTKAPSGPPLDVTFKHRSKSSLMILWTAPDKCSRNGKLIGYQVCYSDQTKSKNPTCIGTNTSRALSYTIKNLAPSTKYFVTVSAGTISGFGPKSRDINKTTNGGNHACFKF